MVLYSATSWKYGQTQGTVEHILQRGGILSMTRMQECLHTVILMKRTSLRDSVNACETHTQIQCLGEWNGDALSLWLG